jgi:uncharacterized repeat protein (TIGR02543 family)
MINGTISFEGNTSPIEWLVEPWETTTFSITEISDASGPIDAGQISGQVQVIVNDCNPFTITFDSNGGTGTMPTLAIATGTSDSLTANAFTRTGYTFAGWATTSGGTVAYANSANYTMGNADVSLYAKWTIADSQSFCKGAKVAAAGSGLKFYTALTGGSPLAETTALVTKNYFVIETINNVGSNPRVPVAITVNALPVTPSALTSLESKKICKYIDSDTPVLFSATPTGASSYIWTTTINNITEEDITNDGATALISFKKVSKTPGAIGSVKVQIQDANGCISLPRALALTTAVPTAPTSLVMTSANSTPHFKGLVSAATESTPAVYGLFGLNFLTAGIKKVGPYMGTETEFTLTAAEAPTAASYEWTLNGATQLSGDNERTITVDFSGVEPGIGSLPIVVKSVGGCGTSTARTLTLARAVPGAPTALVLTDGPTALTKVSPYTGKSTELTLTATPFTTQGGTATSYAWILPAGVNCLTDNTPTMVKQSVNTGTFTTEGAPIFANQDFEAISTGTESTITVDFAGAATAGVLSFPLSVFAVNRTGNSKARTRIVTAAAPATPAIVGSGGNGTAAQFGSCLSKTYTATLIPGATYNWTAPEGTITQTGNVIVVDYSATLVPLLGTSTVTCSATNGTATSGVKSLTVKRIACTTPAPRFSDVTEKFSVVAFPNPSSTNFNLSITSSSAKNVEVKVYDMIGKLINKMEVSPSKVAGLQIGDRYPSGVYNVTVSQGTEVKTLRVIKQ